MYDSPFQYLHSIDPFKIYLMDIQLMEIFDWNTSSHVWGDV
jgi:hypothetical protein